MYLPGLPTLQEDLGTTPAMAQLTITGFMLGMAVGNLLFGALSDSTGRKRPIMIASVCFFAASVLCAIAPSIELLVAARVIQGLAGGSMMVVARRGSRYRARPRSCADVLRAHGDYRFRAGDRASDRWCAAAGRGVARHFLGLSGPQRLSLIHISEPTRRS